MTTEKVALTIPTEVLKLARREVASGRGKSLSSFVSDALNTKVRRDELETILDAMDVQHGKPGKKDRAWAKRVLGRSS
jgi:Arc/MetJ-type ribon-helix-helix transcriptional regulator